MRSSIKVLVGGVAIFLLAVAPPRQKTTKLSESLISENTEPGAVMARIASARVVSELSAELVETDEAATESRSAAPFEAFGDWLGRYETATVKTAGLLHEGERIALDRKAALAKLIEADPEQALRFAIPYEQRKILPGEIARHLEEQVSGYGRYDVIGVAPGYGAPQGRSIERLVTLNERTFKASVYGRRLGQMSAEKLPLHGIAIGESLAVAEHPVRVLGAAEAADRFTRLAPSAAECPISQKVGRSAYAAEIGGEVRYFCHDGHIEALNTQLEKAESGALARQSAYKVNAYWTLGEKTLLFIRVNFADDPSETITAEAAASLMQNVNAFFRLNSYDKLSIRSTVTPLLTLPNTKYWYRSSSVEMNFRRILDDAREVAAAAGFDTANYDLDCVHLNGGVVSPRGYIGAKGATLSDERVAAACHELGHNLGLSHANGWRTTDGSIIGRGSDAEYENKFDTMGNSKDAPGQYNACHKYRLNWLPDSAVQTIDQDGIYRLYAYDVPSLEPGRTYALRMVKDSDRDYWIETRQNSPLMKMGELLINWSPWYMSQGGTELLDMVPDGWGGFYDAQLGMGHSFYDPQLGVKIIPLARNGTSPESVDVMVKHVRYLASFGRVDDSATDFAVDVAEAGQYSVWCRTSNGTANVALIVDGTLLSSVSFEIAKKALPGWSRIIDPSRTPVLLSLSPGQHNLRLTGSVQSDAIVVTDDPTVELPPDILPSAAAAPNGGGIAPRLSLGIDGGNVVLGFKEGSQSTWVIQATSDFVTWETVGMLGPGQAIVRDAAAHQTGGRFYRAVRY